MASCSAAGTASRVALAAARGGRSVQLVGKTGDDATADAIVLDLARGGVGHVALLRDPANPTPVEAGPPDDLAAATEDIDGAREAEAGDAALLAIPALEAADVDLGLRYLTDYRVVVLAEPSAADVDRGRRGRRAVGRGAADRRRRARAGQRRTACPAMPSSSRHPTPIRTGRSRSWSVRSRPRSTRAHEPETAFRASLASDGWSGAEPG